MTMQLSRFRDPGSQFWLKSALVECPRCKGAALAGQGMVACKACGYSRRADEPGHWAARAPLLHAAWKPRCRRCGGALPKVARQAGNRAQHEVPIRCRSCGAVHRYPVYSMASGAAQDCDVASGLPYFLQATVRGQVLWVRNLDHLAFLEDYISARHRERHLGPVKMTTAARLPLWIKAAGSRAELTRALAAIRAKARAAGCA